eukprot:3083299-Prymnesium_polylepis.1
MELAFGELPSAAKIEEEEEEEEDEVSNQGRLSLLHRLFDAIRRGRDNVAERVWVHCQSKGQMESVRRMLIQRNLWDDSRCKMYYGDSTNKHDLLDTKSAWEQDVYLVICNSAVTVAINVDVPFGAAFMFTDNSPMVGLLRDSDQGIVRIWRRPELEPPPGNDTHGRSRDGTPRIFVLLGCAVPLTTATSLDDVCPPLEWTGGDWRPKKRCAVSLCDYPAYLQRCFDHAMKEIAGDAARGKSIHGRSGSEISLGTMEIMAWNMAERRANSSQHFATFVWLSSLSTRGFALRCIEPYSAEEIDTAGARGGSEEEEEEGGGQEEEEADVFDVERADANIRSMGLDDDR